MQKGANIFAPDCKGCTPVDFASISVSIWPFFASKGAEKTLKSTLVEKGIVRKVQKGETRRPESRIKSLSVRPGSAYVRTQIDPFAAYGGISKGVHRESLQSRSKGRTAELRGGEGYDILSLEKDESGPMEGENRSTIGTLF